MHLFHIIFETPGLLRRPLRARVSKMQQSTMFLQNNKSGSQIRARRLKRLFSTPHEIYFICFSRLPALQRHGPVLRCTLPNLDQAFIFTNRTQFPAIIQLSI